MMLNLNHFTLIEKKVYLILLIFITLIASVFAIVEYRVILKLKSQIIAEKKYYSRSESFWVNTLNQCMKNRGRK